MTDKDDDNFLSRWSRRKRLIEEEENQTQTVSLETPEQAENAPLNLEIATEDDADEEREPIEEELEMLANREAAEAVDIDGLDYESDFQLFLKKGVPEKLKNIALRKLWGSNPLLANVDGLNDYDEDFGDPALNVFNSTWQVGRGFLTEEERDGTKSRIAAILDSVDDEESLVEEVAESSGEPEEPIVENTEIRNAAIDDDIVQDLEIETPDPEELDDAPKRISLRSRLIEE